MLGFCNAHLPLAEIVEKRRINTPRRSAAPRTQAAPQPKSGIGKSREVAAGNTLLDIEPRGRAKDVLLRLRSHPGGS